MLNWISYTSSNKLYDIQLPGKEISNVSTQKNVGAKKTNARKKPISKFRSCLQTFLQLTDIPTGGVRLIPMEKGIYGFEYGQAIGNDECQQVLNHEQLGVSVVDTYVRYIRSTLVYYLNNLFTLCFK